MVLMLASSGVLSGDVQLEVSDIVALRYRINREVRREVSRGGTFWEDDVTRLEFIEKIAPAALKAEQKSGIPKGWFIAQAIQESGGYGKSDLSVNANNLYGIKDSGDNAYYQGSVGYARFSSWDESIDFQAFQLTVPRYAKHKALIVAGKFKAYGDAIQSAGYCAPSIPTYGTMIADIARTYELDWVHPPYSAAQQWIVENGIFNEPVEWEKPVTMNTLAWALYKGRNT
jgi:hypothetical protein